MIRINPSSLAKVSAGAVRTIWAPMILKMLPGMPKARRSGRLMPRLNRMIFQMSLKVWMMPTKRSAMGKGKIKTTNGIITVEEPKPVRVPMIAAISVRVVRASVCI